MDRAVRERGGGHLGSSTNFSTSMTSSLKDFLASLLADSSCSRKSASVCAIRIPWGGKRTEWNSTKTLRLLTPTQQTLNFIFVVRPCLLHHGQPWSSQGSRSVQPQPAASHLIGPRHGNPQWLAPQRPTWCVWMYWWRQQAKSNSLLESFVFNDACFATHRSLVSLGDQ